MAFERLKKIFGVGKSSEEKAPASAQNTGKRQLPPDDDPAKTFEEVRDWANERNNEIDRQSAGGARGAGGAGASGASAGGSNAVPDGDLTIGMLTFKVKNENGKAIATEGTVSVLGANVQWTAVEPIVLQRDNSNQIVAYGKVKFRHEKLDFGEEVVIGVNSGMSSLSVDGPDGILYTENGITLATGIGGTLSLDEIVPRKLAVKSPTIPNTNDDPFKGTLKITPEGIVGDAEKNALGFADSAADIIQSAQKKYVLFKGESGLKYQIDMKDAEINYSIDKIFSIKGKTPIIGEIKSDGGYIYHVSNGQYTVSAFGRDFLAKDLPVNFDLTYANGQLSTDNFNIHFDTFAIGPMTAANVAVNINFTEKSLSLDSDSVTFANIPLIIGKTTITANSTGFSIAQTSAELSLGEGDEAPKATANITGLSYAAEKLSVNNFSANVPEITLSDNFKLNSADLSGKLSESGIDLSATVGVVVDYKGSPFSISAPEGVTASISYHKGAGTGGNAPAGGKAEGKAIDTSDTLGKDISVSITGALSADLVINGKVMASAEVADFSYGGGAMSFGELELSADISKIFPSLGGTGVFHAENLVYGSQKSDFDSLALSLKNSTFKGNALPEITVKVNKGGAPEKTSADGKVEVPLDANTNADLQKLSFTLNIDQPSLDIEASTFSTNIGPFAVEAENAVITLSTTGFSSSFETLSVSNDDLGGRIAAFCGLDSAAFTLDKLKFGTDGFSVEGLGMQFTGDAKLFKNVHLVDPKVSYDFVNKSLGLDITLSYEGDDSTLLKAFSGKMSLSVGTENITVNELSDFALDFGSWGKGGVESAEKNEEGITLTGVTLAHEASDDSLQFEGMNPVLAGVLKQIPDMKIRLETLKITKDGIDPIKAGSFTIQSFKKTFKFADGITGDFNYDSTNGFGVGLKAEKSFPEEQEEGKTSMGRIAELNLKFDVVPCLSAGLNFHADTGFKAAMGAAANVSKDAAGVTTFKGSIDGKASGAVGAGIGLTLTLGIKDANTFVKLEGDIIADGDASLTANSQFTHDPSLPFLHSFSLDREQTAVDYNVAAALKFALTVTAGAKAGIPAFIAKDKSLSVYHSWNIKTLELGNVMLKGSVKYENNSWNFIHSEDNDFLNKFRIDHVEEQINEFGETYDSLKRDMESVQYICSKVTEGNVIGLDALMNDKTITGLGSLYEKLKDIRKQGMDNSMEAYKLMALIKKRLANKADEGERNLKEVEALENIELQSQQASDIILGKQRAEKQPESESENTEAEAENSVVTESGVTAKEYAEFMKRVKAMLDDPDGSEMKKLSEIDPVAVTNMLKVYKLKGSKSWESFRLNESQGSLTAFHKMLAKDPKAAASKSKSKTNDDKIFKEALESLSSLQDNCYNKLADVQMEIDDTEEKIKALDNDNSKRQTKNAKQKQEYQTLLEEKQKQKEKLLKTEVEGVQMSSSIGGFTEFLSVQNRHVQSMVSAKADQYKSVENVALTEDVLSARKAWLRGILGNLTDSYYNAAKNYLTPEFEVTNWAGFERTLRNTLEQASKRRNALESGEWFEDDLKSSYGLNAFTQRGARENFGSKKNAASEYTRLKNAYNNINSSITNFFELLKVNMQTTESLMKVDFSSFKSTKALSIESEKIIDAVNKTDETEKAIPKKPPKSVEELIKQTA